jgi:hypothetical protein
MAEIIQDGTGKSYGAKVDIDGRLHVDSIGTDREAYSSQLGNSFNLNTGRITLTNAATDNAVMYVKNNESSPLVLSNFFYQTGASTGGSGNIYVSVIRNPTTGTIVSGATAGDINVNRNFGSSKALDVTFYKGATGTTFTDGQVALESILPTSTQRIAVSAGSITLPKGSSVGIRFTTPTGNTSMIVEFAIACYLETEEGQI